MQAHDDGRRKGAGTFGYRGRAGACKKRGTKRQGLTVLVRAAVCCGERGQRDCAIAGYG
jgi:hypothetical protein